MSANRPFLHSRSLPVAVAALVTALWLVTGAHPAYAATITVAKANGVGVVVIGNDGRCSLIEAINNANDTTNGRPHADCAAGNPQGPDTINLPAATTFTLTQVFDALGPTGLPAVDSTITIKGNGATVQRGANAPFFRLFEIRQSGNLSLEDVTLAGGYIPIGFGGAVRNNRGTLTITGGEVVNNSAPYGGGVANESGTVILTQSVISGNTATSAGGGVFNYNGYLSIGNGQFAGNRVVNSGDGGAIWNVTNSQLDINHSTFSLNEAYKGGAIYNSDHSTATISRTTLDGNEAFTGGAIRNNAGSRLLLSLSTLNNNIALHDGGAIYNDSSAIAPDVEIVNSTLSYNNANDGSGGAIFNNLGVIALLNVTLTGNTAAYGGGGLYHNVANVSLIARSIVSGNWAAVGDEIFSTYENAVQSEYSVFGHSGATIGEAFWNFIPGAATFDVNAAAGGGLQPPLTDLNRILDPALKLNGGATKNHALPYSSLAVDWALSADCLAGPVAGSDQRGLSRNANGSQSEPVGDRECDAGAVERQIGERVVSKWWISILKPKALTYGGMQMDFQPGDVLGYSEVEDQWSVLFDASAAGIAKNVTSIGLLADGSVLLAFGANQPITGLGTLTPWDVARYEPATGQWAWYLDGSTVGLTGSGEKIDAITTTPEDHLVISTTGAASIVNAAGATMAIQDEDLVAFTPAPAGASGGSWAMFLDGSLIPGLAAEDVTGASIEQTTGDIYLALQNSYNVGGVSGTNKELIVIGRGPQNSYSVAETSWNGPAVGFTGVPDAIEIQ